MFARQGLREGRTHLTPPSYLLQCALYLSIHVCASKMNTTEWTTLLINGRLARMADSTADYDTVETGAVAVAGEHIAWVGTMAQLPTKALESTPEVVDCQGQLVSPGLIDCHTHIVYGGNRAREFEMRLNGASYEEIARAGGGINSTVRDTRKASEEVLYAQAASRIKRLMGEGVTGIEIKSGYGLSAVDEARMLKVARQLGRDLPIDVYTTFLGAHALPPEYAGEPDNYIDYLCGTMLPQVAEQALADAVDAFCEHIGFSPAQVRRVFEAAATHQLPVKLHAEQLSNLRGAVLAARHNALSVDHLEYLDPEDVPVLARHGTVAVLLPGAFYCLGETKLPPVDALRQHAVPIALATDSNPGSSPVTSLLLMLSMGCTLFGLTPAEALAGVTRNGARALGALAHSGTLEAGKRANLALWDVQEPAELAYRVGDNPCTGVMYRGRWR